VYVTVIIMVSIGFFSNYNHDLWCFLETVSFVKNILARYFNVASSSVERGS